MSPGPVRRSGEAQKANRVEGSNQKQLVTFSGPENSPQSNPSPPPTPLPNSLGTVEAESVHLCGSGSVPPCACRPTQADPDSTRVHPCQHVTLTGRELSGDTKACECLVRGASEFKVTSLAGSVSVSLALLLEAWKAPS